MPTVDLVCTYADTLGDVWLSGSNISASDGSLASIQKGQYSFARLGFTTDAATAIPVGATKTAVQLILRVRSQNGGGIAYVKDPGGFTDGGAAAHSLAFTTTLTTYTSIDISGERPAVLTDPLTSGYLRLFHDYVSPAYIYVDYMSLRVTYTVSSGSSGLFQFMATNF